MIPFVIATLSRVAAQKLLVKTTANVAKRVARLEKEGVYTKAMTDFAKVKFSPKGKTRNEIVSHLAKVAKLDANPGTRAASAGKVAAREAKSLTRRQALNDLDDFKKMRKMTTEQLKDLYQWQRKSVISKSNRVKAGEYKSTHATRKLDEFLDTTVRNPTRNQLASYATQLRKISKFEGITTAGAKRQDARGAEKFGEAYNDLKPAEKEALWDAVHRYMEDRTHTLGSEQVIAHLNELLNDGDTDYAFTVTDVKDDSDNPVYNEDGTQKQTITADLGLDSDAEVQKTIRNQSDSLIESYTKDDDEYSSLF